MTFSDAILAIGTMTESELSDLNRAVITELKARRSAEASRKRFLFKSGDKVSYSGRNGYTEGTIVRVKRKKAIVNVPGSGNWDVPLAMLSAA